MKIHPTELIDRQWLTERTFEVTLSKPPSYDLKPGQRIRIYHQTLSRDYTPVSAPADPALVFCVRQVEAGEFTSVLSTADIGTRFDISGPDGYFIFKPSRRPPVFVATGTGIAPFCAMVRSGVSGFTLLHGVNRPQDLYYQSELESVAERYVPCISAAQPSSASWFHGRVTEWLQKYLQPAKYDFYLCGRQEMIRDVTWLVDERFDGSLIYSELFY